jgi:hypothetical protein
MGVCCSRVRPDEEAVPTLRFTAEWLTKVLRERGVLPVDAAVSSLAFKDLGAVASDGKELPNGGGLAGASVLRIHEIEYTDAAGEPLLAAPDGKELPTALVHKWASSRELLQALKLSERVLYAVLLKLNQYYGVRREVAAYQGIVPELRRSAGIRTPACCACGPPTLSPVRRGSALLGLTL